MYKSFSIIGAGSLGGFIAREIANLPTTEKMIIMDFDKVEERNLRNSVYRKPHLGKPKVRALANLIKRDNPSIALKMVEGIYDEHKTYLPATDLTIDCRDVICSRGDEIDVRLYMSSRNLIVDCRRNVSYEDKKEGSYLIELSKHELKYAGSCFVMLLNGDIMDKLIEKQVVHKIYLDHVTMKGASAISKVSHRTDLVRDHYPGEEKLIGLSENIFKIIEMNSKGNVEICVGDSTIPSAMKKVQKGLIKNPSDVIRYLTSTLDLNNQPVTFNCYIVSPISYGSRQFIELIPETGAA